MRTLLRLLGRGVADLARNPLAQTLTLAAVTLTAFLAGLFLLFVVNLNQELLTAKGGFAFQVYWRADADMRTLRAQWQEFDALDHLQGKQTFSPDQALDELARTLESPPEDLRRLSGDSPLPATAVLWFSAPQGADPELFAQGVLRKLGGLPGVADVHYSALELGLAKAWSGFSRSVLWPLIAFLGLVTALIVGNTLRLSLASRRDEVEILQLVGAGTWYIRLPLVTGGAVLGFAGGCLSLGLLKAVQLPLAELFNTPPLNLSITFLPPEYALGLVACVTAVAALASAAVARA
ncbi:cell division protein FtsX [Desulfocurvus sp. DL9XJH121]